MWSHESVRTRILPAFKTIVLRSSTNFLTKDELDKLRVYAHLLLQEFCKNKFHQLCARKWVDRQNDVVYHDRDVINDNTHLIEGVPGYFVTILQLLLWKYCEVICPLFCF
ncbi:hypothetical protein AAMO2058_000924700 [Amorphochlora amoebiformis]